MNSSSSVLIPCGSSHRGVACEAAVQLSLLTAEDQALFRGEQLLSL